MNIVTSTCKQTAHLLSRLDRLFNHFESTKCQLFLSTNSLARSRNLGNKPKECDFKITPCTPILLFLGYRGVAGPKQFGIQLSGHPGVKGGSNWLALLGHGCADCYFQGLLNTISCILDTFYDNLKATDLVIFFIDENIKRLCPSPSYSPVLKELQN